MSRVRCLILLDIRDAWMSVTFTMTGGYSFHVGCTL